MGAMVFGGTASERIQFNEDTLWRGKPHDYVREGAGERLAEIRRLVFEGQASEAGKLAREKAISDPVRQLPYQPFGDLRLTFPGHESVMDYRRDLDLDSAIATVRYTPLAQWTARGTGGAYVVKRLNTSLTTTQVRQLRAAAERHAGKPYDLYFEWSDGRIYCSELVWKAYHEALGVELGARQKLREFDLADPVVKAKMRERYGEQVPMDEPVISPAALFESRELVKLPR
jgi:hypothetical protein